MGEIITCLCPKEKILILSISQLNASIYVYFKEPVSPSNLIMRAHKEPGQHVI